MSEFLEMSDEEFMNASPSMEVETVVETVEQDADDQTDETPEESEETPEAESESEPMEGEDDSEHGVEGDEEEDASGEEEEGTKDTEPEIDLSDVLKPFKANGKEMQVKNAAEAVQLMQLGANYTKKMQSLQPNLKLLKTLEKNELLDPSKLNYLIDLSNKDPKAIQHLLKDSGFDPLEYEESEADYVPQDHQVSEQSIQVSQVLESIESTPTYSRCLDVVGNQWDGKSKDELTAKPQLIAELNEQMQLGIYDKIMQEVDRAKVFGGLSGMSDFEAYKAVGAQLMQQGALTPTKPEPVAKTTVSAKPKDTNRSNQRKAASTPRAAKKTSSSDFNPLSMSDAEFMKLHNIDL
jgi:hypothetical protein